MKKRIFVVAAAILSSTAYAQDSTRLLNEVVVTANKYPQKQNETGRVLSVITREQLSRAYGKSLTELLNQQVGLTINGANNNLGTNQSLYVRGAGTGNTLILVDGIPQNDASGVSSEFDLNAFNLDQIERVEILKGTQSTLYGSDAVAGVVNIITRKATGKAARVNIHGVGGSFGTFRGGININGTVDGQGDYYVGYSTVQSDGFSSAFDSTGAKKYDRDGFNQQNLQFGIGFKSGERFSGKVYGRYNSNKADLDAGAFRDDRDFTYHNRNVVFGTTLQYKLKKHTLFLNYNNNWVDRSFTDDSTNIGGFSKFQQGNYTGRTQFVELYGNFALGNTLNLTTGADYRRAATDQAYAYVFGNSLFSSLPISDDTARTEQYSLFASLLWKTNSGFIAELGGRFNNHSIYGNNSTFSFTPSYRINDKIRVFANISSGYRVPSLYQLYSEYGNRDLKPELSLGYEAGAQYTDGATNIRLVGFRREIKDVILFFTDAVTFNSFYRNGDEQKDLGLELEAATTLADKWQLSANYTFVDGEITTALSPVKDTSFFNLFRRPKHTGNLSVGYTGVKNLTLTSHLRAVNDFFEPRFGQAPFTMNGYYTVDLYAAYKASNHVKLFVDAQNITNQRYFDTRGFNSRRFNMAAGILLNW